MLTKNYYKALAGTYLNFLNDTETGAGQLYLIKQHGYALPVSYYQLRYYVTHSHPTEIVITSKTNYKAAHAGIAFGDGNAEPTLDDLTLSGNLITTLSGTVSRSVTVGDTGCEDTYVYTLTNTGSDPVTIRELGIFSSYVANDADTTCLIDRVVLDTPVTIPSGSTGEVTYKFKVKYPA